MSSEWPLVRLGDLVSLIGGLSYKASEISFEGNSMVTMGCISASSPFKFSGLKRYKGAFNEQHTLRPGDIVVATRDVTQNRELIGCPAVIPNNLPGDAIIMATNLYKIKNKSSVENDFLYWVMKSPKYREEVVASSKGTTVVMITKDAIENYIFPLPSEPERREIARTLNLINDRINLLHETNATLEAIAQALFKSWFVDFDPVRAKMAGRMPEGMDEDTAALFPDSFEETELGEVPKGWHVAPLSTICSISSGKRPLDRSDQYYTTTPVALYGGAGVMGFTSQALFCSAKILTGRVGTLGKVFIANPPFWASDNALIISPLCEKSFYFIYHWLCSIDISALNRGSTQPLLTQKDLAAQIGAVAPPVILSAFHEIVRLLYDKIQESSEHAKLFISLRDLLLPRLVSGYFDFSCINLTTEDSA